MVSSLGVFPCHVPCRRFQSVLLGVIVLTGLSLAAGGLFLDRRPRLVRRRCFPCAGRLSRDSRRRSRHARPAQGHGRRRSHSRDCRLNIWRPRGAAAVLRGEYRRLIRPDAVVRIESDGLVGGKVLEINPARTPAAAPAGELIAEDQMLQGDSSDLMENVSAAVDGIRDGKGSLGKFLTDTEAHDAFVDMIHQGTKALAKSQETATTLQQDADALKRLPVVGAYVEDPAALLQRYKSERQRRIFNANELFEPGRAVLTAQGRQDLDGLGTVAKRLKHPGSDVVIVAYADPHSDNPQAAQVLTRQQSETVCDYLKTKHGVQKLGLVFFAQGDAARPGRRTAADA